MQPNYDHVGLYNTCFVNKPESTNEIMASVP